jgi:NAD(P)-dependent dehydrogenase (short-subunit alcohol dehydrogenase family)
MYSVSKAAAHVRIILPYLRSPLMRNQHLGRNLAVELGPRNITSNVVAPGFFPSKLASGLIDKLGGTKELENANPRKRLGEPEDIAGVMVYLCSPAGSYMYAPHSITL